jgi:hypothetical protein
MVPRWWRQRRKVRTLKAQRGDSSSTQMGDSTQM